MAPLVLLRPADGGGDVVVARRARVRERLAARLRATSLDWELASGVAPEARVSLALRAAALGEQRVRRRLGLEVRRILDDARNPMIIGRRLVPTRRAEVVAAADELDRLADALLAPGPLAARGVAQVRLLLLDGCGPLYFSGAREGLRAAAMRALEALEPTFQW
jgi:hypothetical protein